MPTAGGAWPGWSHEPRMTSGSPISVTTIQILSHYFLPSREYISRKLDQKWRGWALHWALQYRMCMSHMHLNQLHHDAHPATAVSALLFCITRPRRTICHAGHGSPEKQFTGTPCLQPQQWLTSQWASWEAALPAQSSLQVTATLLT